MGNGLLNSPYFGDMDDTATIGEFVPATAAVALAGIMRMLLVRNTDVKFNCGERIYHQMAAEGLKQPHIVINRVSAERPRTMEGTINYVRGLMRIDVYAPTLPQWSAVVKAVGESLENPNADGVVMTAAKQQGFVISYLELDDEQDIPNQPLEGQPGPSMYGTALFFNYMIERPAQPPEE